MLMRDVTVQHATLVLRERLNSLLAQSPPERLMRKISQPHLGLFSTWKELACIIPFHSEL